MEQIDPTKIYCFVSCQYIVVLVTISAIGYDYLSRLKTIDENISGESKIWPLAKWNTSVTANNVPGAGTNCYLMFQPRTIEFVRSPFRIELGCFHDPKIRNRENMTRMALPYTSIVTASVRAQLEFAWTPKSNGDTRDRKENQFSCPFRYNWTNRYEPCIYRNWSYMYPQKSTEVERMQQLYSLFMKILVFKYVQMKNY